ncbi:MAG: hypothetical protein HKO92_11155 [Flavobacteriaceae bacterium]|nr:hypothetical protein [Bacteroidia bacterium]NNK83671.1 hypothetical protein [Flavobacteriaceae bacterium]
MKKIITLCLFVMALFLGTQNSFAQDEKYAPLKEDAKELAMKIQKYVGLDQEQTKVVARAIFAKNKANLDSAEKSTEYANSEEAKAKIEFNLINSLKKVLDGEQLEKVLEMIK